MLFATCLPRGHKLSRYALVVGVQRTSQALFRIEPLMLRPPHTEIVCPVM